MTVSWHLISAIEKFPNFVWNPDQKLSRRKGGVVVQQADVGRISFINLQSDRWSGIPMAFSFQSLITRSLTSTTGDIDEVQTPTKFIR